MQNTSTVSGLDVRANILPLAIAGLLGIFIIGFVGFSHIEAVHNASHDYRHSMAFPCH
jgi:cobalt transporter subunit CbtB